MRHKVYGKHLNRDKNERTALFRSLVQSLLLNESIKTTAPKAKAIKGLVDKIISQAKSPRTRFLVKKFITDKKIEEKLVKDILPRLGIRKSGFTQVVRLGKRLGDGAMLVQMSLLTEKASTSKLVTRSSSKEKSEKPVARKRETK